MSALNNLSDGTIVKINDNEKIFKLHSYKKNPIIGPNDFELTWYEDGRLLIGSIFNAGVNLLNERIILSPRVHAEYQKVNSSINRFKQRELDLRIIFQKFGSLLARMGSTSIDITIH